MPEFYVEAMKDRRTCFKCKLTVTGKKACLFTCNKCHAITYCGEECQRADWDRHEWNCVPVMVKEIPGKGRGLVAATNIKIGEQIFMDNSVIKLNTNAQGLPLDPDFMTSLKEQIEKFPTEAKSQYYKLKTREADDNIFHLSQSDFEVFKLFHHNCRIFHVGNSDHFAAVLHLNVALVNHSCVPNATLGDLGKDWVQANCHELRAIKDISKGEEITTCYYLDVKKYGSILRKRKTAFKKQNGFDCKCPMCLGEVSCQEKVLKKLISLHNKLDPTPTDWKRDAGILNKIVDLNMELLIGGPFEKTTTLDDLARSAHLARDKDLVRKAMDKWRQFADETKLEYVRRNYDILERRFSQWSTEFSSGTPPERREIDSVLASFDTDNDVMIPEVD